MKSPTHQSAKPSHYSHGAEQYDAFNEENSEATNRLIEIILKKHQVKSVLDLTCGTGSQVFWLARHGYDVVGSDINANMLKVARSKAKKAKLSLRFLKGDMRTSKLGQFDAVITIFNAVGHLTKSDFEQAMRNIHDNLKEGGLYIFDINNLDFLLEGDQITDLTIDWQKMDGDKKVRAIQYSTINDDGILASYTTLLTSKVSRSAQTLQVYTAKQLRDMLVRNGFKVLKQLGIDGSKFSERKSDRILTIAKKQ